MGPSSPARQERSKRRRTHPSHEMGEQGPALKAWEVRVWGAARSSLRSAYTPSTNKTR